MNTPTVVAVEQLRSNDVVFALSKDAKYKKVIEKFGNLQGHHDSVAEATEALQELKSGGGYLLYPVFQSHGKSKVVNYCRIESDEEAAKRIKKCIYLYRYRRNNKAKTYDSSDDESGVYSATTDTLTFSSDEDSVEDRDGNIEIGEVGYKFLKSYTVGWFAGEVVAILPDGMRKCFFEADGETEFLNLAELKELSENGGYSLNESSDVNHYVHPNKKNDVILSLTDDKYKAKMWYYFQAMANEKSNLGRPKEVAALIFDEFKDEIGQGGRFLKCEGHHTSKKKKYYAVNEDDAEIKIYRDILRRMDSSHFWLQTGDDGQKKRGTRYDGQKKRGQKKRGNGGPKCGAPAKKRGKTQSLERAAASQSARNKSDSRKEGRKAALSSERAGPSQFARKADSRKDDHLETATVIAPSLDTVGTGESFNIFKDVKSRLEGSHGRAKRFYGHLKRYIAQQMKKVGQNALLRSDYSKIQDYMNEPVVKELNETNDVVEMDFFDGAITALMVDCEKELPLEG